MRSTPYGVGLLVAATLAAGPALAGGPATASAAASGLTVGTQDLRLIVNASPVGGSSLTGQGRLEAALPANGRLALDVAYAAPQGAAPSLGPLDLGADYTLCGETRSRPAVSAGLHLQLPTAPGAGLAPSLKTIVRKRLPGIPVLKDVRLESTLVGGDTVERQVDAALATTLLLAPDTTGRAAVGFREAASGGQTHLEVGVEHRISRDSSVSLMVTRGPSDPDYDLRTQLRWKVTF
jgi:hypothetical protein